MKACRDRLQIFKLYMPQLITMSTAAKIPVIDISATGDEEQAKVAKELVDAAVEHGFVYIKNQGKDIPVESVENAFELVRFIRLDMI